MKARTKAHREVVELSSTLPALNEKDIADARRGYAKIYVGAKKAWCSCCGEVWESDLWTRKKHTEVCPHCKAKGKVVKSAGKWRSNEKYYVTFVRVCKGWQVIRTAICERITEKGEGVEFFDINEVYQRWMRQGTPDVIIGRGVHGCCAYADVWNWESRWEIRNDHYRYGLEGDVCGRTYLAPIVKRGGLKALRDDCGVRRQIFAVMTDAKAEILAKGRQWSMFRHYVESSSFRDVERFWYEIRVAMRHGYKIKDASLWLDMVDALFRCGRDTRNPKYICPDDIFAAHDKAMIEDAKRLDRIAKEKDAREKEKIRKSILENTKIMKRYEDRVGKYLGIVVKKGDLTIQPLQDIKAFYDEGQAMHHCVFKNEYYKKDGVLVLSARKAGARMETIELNTKTWTILQCRGRFNKNSAYHNKIVELMNSNIDKFRRVAVCE